MRVVDTTPQPQLHWGIVGPGKIARKFARDLRVSAGGRLRAVASRDLQRARAFADEFAAELAYDDLMEAMWTRCLPVYARIREWLDEGRIGRPRMVFSSFCVHALRDPAARWFSPTLAGGALLDVGVYNLAVSQLALGRKPGQVTASARLAETGVDEWLAATLRYAHGSVAQSGSHG